MNPRLLNKRISIFRRSEEKNSYGELTGRKEYLFLCWASVRDMNGKAYFEAGVPFNKALTSFMIRSRKDVPLDESMEIEYEGEDYRILHIDRGTHDGRWIIITAERVS